MFKGKWCLVTGGGRGIGEAVAVAFSKENANLVLVSRSEGELRSVASKCVAAGAGQTEIRTVDLSDPAAIDALAADILEKHGAVDVLVNNAGMNDIENLSAVSGDPDSYNKIIAVNLAAPMRLTRRFSPKMVENKWGVIINISSIYGATPSAIAAAYVATKHGLNGWSHSCSKELRPHNVKVLCVQPGLVDTKMLRDAGDKAPALIDMNLSMYSEDVAEACMLAIRTSPKCYPEDIILHSPLVSLP